MKVNSMLEKVIYFDCVMLVLDFVAISELRKFLLDFLVVKKSRKQSNLLYSNQSLCGKITLSFIKSHLKKYTKVFSRFHRLYLSMIYTLFPQYAVIICCNALMGLKSIYILGVFAIIKLVICFLIRINVDSNRVSIYRER